MPIARSDRRSSCTIGCTQSSARDALGADRLAAERHRAPQEALGIPERSAIIRHASAR